MRRSTQQCFPDIITFPRFHHVDTALRSCTFRAWRFRSGRRHTPRLLTVSEYYKIEAFSSCIGHEHCADQQTVLHVDHLDGRKLTTLDDAGLRVEMNESTIKHHCAS